MSALVWNETQDLVAACYEDGAMKHVGPHQLDECGDGLFAFLMREADDVTAVGDFLNRLDRAQERLAHLDAMLREAKW